MRFASKKEAFGKTAQALYKDVLVRTQPQKETVDRARARFHVAQNSQIDKH